MSLLSRALVACSLIAALSSQTTFAQSFAKPPPSAGQPAADQLMERFVVDRAQVRAKLAAARTANLARFRAYRTAGVYPNNVFKPGLANVWRDQAGHYCAAATIIRASGQTALVESVAEQDNFIKLADVTSGPLLDWILTSGLTQDEIAVIQKPFRPVTLDPELDPTRPLPVSPNLRAAETRRLAKLYAQIETQLSSSAAASSSLELATDRLLKYPELAAAFVAR